MCLNKTSIKLIKWTPKKKLRNKITNDDKKLILCNKSYMGNKNHLKIQEIYFFSFLLLLSNIKHPIPKY
jgi:hypothetical protein